MKKAVFPGSFDPFTLGHKDVIDRALPLFDEIYIAIGVNSTKNSLFTQEQRELWIKETYKNVSKIKVVAYHGLTVDLCRELGAGFILRGLRNSMDFEYETAIARMNHDLNTGVETVFLITAPQYSAISSTIVREIYKNKGDISKFVPFKI